MKEDPNQINLVEFAKEDKNPTLTKLNKQKEDTEKKKNKTEDALKANQEYLQESEANIQVLQNGNDYIETVEKLCDPKYKDLIKILDIKDFDPESIVKSINEVYDKTKAELIKKNTELQKSIESNKKSIVQYNEELTKLNDDISDYKMKLKTLVDLLMLSSDDLATDRERAEDVISAFEELQKNKRELCAKIIFPDSKFRNSIKKAFSNSENEKSAGENKEPEKSELKDLDKEKADKIGAIGEPIFVPETSVDEKVVGDITKTTDKATDESQIEKANITPIYGLGDEETTSFVDIQIPGMDEPKEEKVEEVQNSNLSKQVLDVFEKNGIDYSERIEEYSSLDDNRAMNILKVFEILSDKGIPLNNLRYSVDKLLQVDPDKFNTVLNDFLSIKSKNDVSLAISALLDSNVNIEDTKEAIVGGSNLPISSLVRRDNDFDYDNFLGR